MLAVQPYHAGGYPPPGRRWPQFGDQAIEAALGGADSIRSKLQAKRDAMRSVHLGRLEDQGIVPMGAPAAHPAAAGVAAFDHFQLPPSAAPVDLGRVGPGESVPSTPERNGVDISVPSTPAPQTPLPAIPKFPFPSPEHFNIGSPTSIATMSPPPQTYYNSTLASPDRAEVTPQPSAATFVGQALRNQAAAAGGAVSAAMQPGSQARTMAHSAASTIALAGPPIVHGAHAIAHLAGEVVPPIAAAAVTGASAIGHAAMAAGPPAARAVGRAASAAARGAGHGAMALGGALAHGASRGVEMARAALESSDISVGDFVAGIQAMREAMELPDRPSTHAAITDGSQAALPGPAVGRRNRMATPPPRRSGSSSSSSARARPEVSFSSEKDWLEHVQSKTALVEELYKRPNWRDIVQHLNSSDLRKKMGKLSREDIAKMLVALDA